MRRCENSGKPVLLWTKKTTLAPLNGTNIKIPFHIPYLSGKETDYLAQVIRERYMSGDGAFTEKVSAWWTSYLEAKGVLLTTSCTHALEMAALLLDIEAGDEVIMPSFTFVSTATAFVLRGARIVFADIDPATMNISPGAIEAAISPRTKAIVVMHYAGIGCEMAPIMALAEQYGLAVVEDAAHCPGAYYQGRHLGTFGKLGSFSFHDTKNIHCGEGGALIINDEIYLQRAGILREKGTNRKQFLQGMIDRYTWVDIGSSYAPGELKAAFLYAQVSELEAVNRHRLALWNRYREWLEPLQTQGILELPFVPDSCTHNAHLFYIKCRDKAERSSLITFLKARGIGSAFHYIPLHSSPAGQKFGFFHGEDRFTTRESERLLRLPLYYDLGLEEVEEVVAGVREFYGR